MSIMSICFFFRGFLFTKSWLFVHPKTTHPSHLRHSTLPKTERSRHRNDVFQHLIRVGPGTIRASKTQKFQGKKQREFLMEVQLLWKLELMNDHPVLIWKNGSLDPTWRIIPFSKQLGSPPIYEPQISAIKGRGPTTPAGLSRCFLEIGNTSCKMHRNISGKLR